MAYISIDVDIDKFDTEDIIDELKRRLSKLDKREKKCFDELIKEYKTDSVITSYSKVDEWKIDVFRQNHHKFTLEEIETFFNSKS